jgi:transposase
MIAKIGEMVTERDDFERSFETVKYLRKRRKKKTMSL